MESEKEGEQTQFQQMVIQERAGPVLKDIYVYISFNEKSEAWSFV